MNSTILPCCLGITAATLLQWPTNSPASDDAFELPPINYSKTEPTDRIARLRDALKSGKVRLDATLPEKEFVGELLKTLEIPSESQVLVFSKTSLQNSHINPKQPRALYFSDDIYFGWSHKSNKFEIIAADPKLGATFYLLERDPNAGKIEVFRESGDCFSCHASSRTGGRPGMTVRSLYVDKVGQPIFSAGSFQVDYTTPFEDRWGGWYVTGYHGDARHLGNIFSEPLTDGRATFDRETGANVTKLDQFFDTSDYLLGTSDIVALMVMEHQITMHNRIIEGDYTVRSALYRSRQLNKELGVDDPNELSDSCKRIISHQADNILECLLFRDEAPLPSGGIDSKGPFMAAFVGKGKASDEGRSLRDFQLLDRIFKYRCSYMIYSSAFANLPQELKVAVLDRLDGILTGSGESDLGDHLTQSERDRIREILVDTLDGYPGAKTKVAAVSGN
ncbi:MAG: hypothetical protein KDM63_14080 [Verrucomicrobiae bacterium]|nr:hypothetical protein [Verrucomicrobiae bacterium]